jgi:ferredoxin-NADP reductase
VRVKQDLAVAGNASALMTEASCFYLKIIYAMKKHLVKIKSIKHITHDVLQIVTEKPQQYIFTPGQATEVSVNKKGWQIEKRPFTFTCLPENDYLEFTIKTYPSHKGVTNELLQLKMNDELILHDVFGAIAYKHEGVFIAGGAGVTPFISIFRYLQSKNEIGHNKLIFANKTKADIILEQEFEKLLGNNFINILSDEKVDGYEYGQITEDFIKSKIDGIYKDFYICGPPPMMDSIEKQLENLHINEHSIIKEAF